MKHPAIPVTLIFAGILGLSLGLNRVNLAPRSPDLAAVYLAAQAYRQSLETEAKAVPAAVSAPELLQAGWLAPAQAQELDGWNVVVSLRPDVNRPHEVLMRVGFPDGAEMAVLCDGSVQRRL